MWYQNSKIPCKSFKGLTSAFNLSDESVHREPHCLLRNESIACAVKNFTSPEQ